MKYTADYIIQKRKENWEEKHDIEFDRVLTVAIANKLVEDKELLEEAKAKPEKLIEMIFTIVDKEQKTVPFFLNDVQKDFIDNKLNKAIKDFEKGKITDISLLILKGRQLGFTTLVTAYQLAYSITHKNFQGFTLADKSDNSEAIFQNKAKFIYQRLPEVLKPTEKFNNRRQLLFEKINSSWEVDTATENVGRSRTINFFHGSECAFWQKGIASIQASLGEAFTKNCIKIYESTANGFNDFQKMWKSETNINCFYEWWKTKEYVLDFPNDKVKNEFVRDINSKNDWIYTRLKWLKEEKRLSLKQIYWYFKKYESYIDKRLIKQEYPCTPDEAFLLSGECIFDTEQILLRLSNIKKPLKVGYFDFTYDDTKLKGSKISNIKWVDNENGYISIYKDVDKLTPYVLGGDTAGEGSDWFTGHVLDNTTGEQVAKLRHQMDEDIYTRQMYCLGKYYNEALIGIEANFSSFPIKEMERLGYTKQYVRKREDTYTHKKIRSYGFKTTSITRPVIIANLVEIVREEIEKINDRETLEEMLTFVRNEKGRPEAQDGTHDDLVMGLAIAHYIREQQSMKKKKEPVIPPEDVFKSMRPKRYTGDYGVEIKVI